MIRLLWVEDQPLDQVAPSTLYERRKRKEIHITHATSYLRALDRIILPDLQHNFDAIVLDARLPPYLAEFPDESHPHTLPLLMDTLAEWYKGAPLHQLPDKFLSEAGYLLFRDLVLKHRFPAERIVFLSGHLDHLNTLLDSLNTAMIALDLYVKADAPPDPRFGASEQFLDKIAEWENDEYLRLRRCVIDLTGEISELVRESDTVPFLEFLDPQSDQSDWREQLLLFLASLRHSLPIVAGTEESRSQVLAGFVRALAAPWDRAKSRHLSKQRMNDEDFVNRKAIGEAFISVRNLSAHNKIAGAFTVNGAHTLFLAAMGVMFGRHAVPKHISHNLQAFDLSATSKFLHAELAAIMRQCGAKGIDVDAVPKKKPKPGEPPTYALRSFGACLTELAHQDNQYKYNAHPAQLVRLLWHNLFPRKVRPGDAANPDKISGPLGGSDAQRLAQLADSPHWDWLATLLRWEAGRSFLETRPAADSREL